jgi:hypothetical protein
LDFPFAPVLFSLFFKEKHSGSLIRRTVNIRVFHLTMETTQKLVPLPAKNAEAIAPSGSVVAAPSADSKSDLESVVIALFDAFHGRVLNYVLTCGLTFHESVNASNLARWTYCGNFYLRRVRYPVAVSPPYKPSSLSKG